MNISLLISELSGLVGFRNSTIPKINDWVNTTNQTSDSGLIYNDGHNLVSINNMLETFEDKDININGFNTYLTNLSNSCIIDVCKKIVQERKLFKCQSVLYPYAQSFESTYDVSSGFVGIELLPAINDNILINISAITASFDSSITLPIKLINSETVTEIASQDIETIDKDAVRQRVNWDISLTKDRTGGTYFIGYNASGLSGAKPYKREYDLASYDYNYFNAEYKKIPYSGSKLDIRSHETIEQPYGLNIEYSVYTDYSMMLIRNKYLLARAVQLQMAERVIEQIFTSTRSNFTERQTKELRGIANFALEGSEAVPGIRRRLASEIKSVKKMFWPEPRIIRETLG